jgi:methionyl-tRNA formyltransferase
VVDPSSTAERPALPAPASHPRRLVFFGSPELATVALRALHDAGFEIVRVITQPDKRRGRGGATTPTPVKQQALALGLAVGHDPTEAIGCDADLGVVVAYGEILRRPVLEALPMVNIHFSLLPRWRGAAPVERALLAGDERTGVCLMAVEEGLDTGGVYASRSIEIRRTSTAAELGGQLAELGAQLLVRSLRDGLGPAVPQAGDVTYAAKVTRQDLELHWERTAQELGRVVRVGGAWTTWRGRSFKVLEAWPSDVADPGPPGTLAGDVVRCGAGGLRLVQVQPEGKAALRFDSWANGAKPGADDRFGSSG